MKKTVSIIGFGRFGKTLLRLLGAEFPTLLYDAKDDAFVNYKLPSNVKITNDLAELYKSDVIFYAVPISSFENVIKRHRKYFKDQLLIDVLSVKSWPASVFKKYMKGTKVQVLLTHPMFGPDSSKDGFVHLPIVIDRFTADQENYLFWNGFFRKKGLKVVEMSAREHDKLAANSQGITHFIGRLLDELGIETTQIDTLGARKLHEVRAQTCNDTWQLFEDLQNFNPFTKNMRIAIGKAYDKTYNKLLPKRVNRQHIVFGIQGGKGSFNEQALITYTRKHRIQNYKVKYLYTTKKVLGALHRGDIDCGQFAIENSVGGLVDESIEAMADYKFRIVEEFQIKIAHFLMRRKDVRNEQIDTIMTHPQVLKQCKSTLAKKYPTLKKKSEKGDMIDHAKVAQAMSKKELPDNIAVMGPEILASIYDLEVIEGNLQDDKTNETSFLVVSRL